MGQKKLKKVKKTFEKSVDEQNSRWYTIVAIIRKGLATNQIEYCESTLTTAYL